MARAVEFSNILTFPAESSEAWFAENDYFPFDREELQRHDSEICALLEQLWGSFEGEELRSK
jgi:hypothetical protein